jgi:hypothetical protein
MSADTWPHELQTASVFYSYANEDDALREALEKQLSMLRRQDYIAPWHKRNITQWRAAITPVNERRPLQYTCESHRLWF